MVSEEILKQDIKNTNVITFIASTFSDIEKSNKYLNIMDAIKFIKGMKIFMSLLEYCESHNLIKEDEEVFDCESFYMMTFLQNYGLGNYALFYLLIPISHFLNMTRRLI